MRGLSLYVHRGLYLKNTFLAEGIHSTWIINLDRRPDRMKRLPHTILDKAVRFPAIDGQTLRLTPALKAMFAPLGWRKGVMGCALSHISLWKKLVEDKP
jgi:GR25 family glycosyltransferase involved in LPS biosynthesis